MTHRILHCFVLVAIWLAPGSAPAFEISGQVTDAAGKPFPRARVELAESRLGYEQGLRWVEGERLPKPVSVAVTDEHGIYRLDVPEPGLWQTTVSAPGSVPMERGPDAFVVDEQLPPVALVADAGLTVTVTDGTGAPLPQSRVWLGAGENRREVWRHAYQGRWRPAYGPAPTDEQGRVRLPRAPGEMLKVQAWAPGYLESPMAVSNGRPVRFELSPGVVRTLEVRDSEGEPLEDVLVRRGGNGWTAALTDAHGRAGVAFSSTGESLVLLDAGDGRWSATAVRPLAPDEDDEPIVLTLPDARIARGQVVERGSGEPVVGALVWYGADDRVSRTDERGSFELRFSGDHGSLSVRSLAPGYSLGRAELSLDGEDLLEVDLALKPAFQIRGRVVDSEGVPVAGAEIWWRTETAWSHSWAPFQSRRTLQTGPDGVFVLGFLHRDEAWELRAERDGYAPAETRVTATDSSDLVELVLTGGSTLVGRVVGPEGEAVPGAELSIFEADGGREQFLSPESLGHETPEWTAGTRDDGSFEVPRLPEVRLAVAVDAPGYVSRWLTGIVADQGVGVVDLGEVALDRGAILQGRVVDSRDEPVAEAEVILGRARSGGLHFLSDDSRRGETRRLTTGPEGTFRFEDLSPGASYSVAARKPGLAPALVEHVRPSFDAPEPPLELALGLASQIHGEVVGPQGRPLAEVGVRLIRTWSDSGGEGQSVHALLRTDAEGRFTFEDLPAGRFLVRAPLDHSAKPAEGVPVELEPGETVGPVRLVRDAEAKIRGRVLTPQGGPAAEARVHVEVEHHDDTGQPTGSSSIGTTTDGAGRFRLGGFPVDAARIEAEHAAHGRTIRTLDLAPGVNEVELLLEETARIEGRVVDAGTGEPVPRARVLLSPTPWDQAGQWSVDSATTDGDGSFLLRPATPGSYRLNVQAEGYVETVLPETLEIHRGALEQMDVRLEPGATITGRVTGLEPAELGRVLVQGHSVEGGRILESRVTTEGRYRLSGAQSGSWEVQARLEDPARRAREQVTVEEGQREVTADLTFEGGYALTARIRYNGKPASQAQVILTALEGGEGWLSQQADYQGKVRFGSLEAGRYRLSIQLRGGLTENRRIDLVTDEEVEVDLSGGAVVGRVLARDGHPVTGARVGLMRQEVAGSIRNASAQTGSEGRFEFDAVAEGTYRLMVQAPSEGAALQTVEVFPPRTDLGDVVLERGEEVLLAIRTADGAPVSRLGGVVRDETGRILIPLQARLEENGSARLTGIPAEGRELVLLAEGYVPVRLALPSGTSPLPIELQPAARIRIRVPELAGVAESYVKMRDAAGRRPIFHGILPGTENGFPMYQGRAGVPALTPGAWTVTVTASDGRTWSREVSVAPGETVEVILE